MYFFTWYNSEDLAKKYSYGIGNVRELEERGCLVLYKVDALQMSQHFFLKTQRFDRIVYNFPHVGFLYPEDNNCQIKLCLSFSSTSFLNLYLASSNFSFYTSFLFLF